MSGFALLDHLASRCGWALLHSIWQLALIAAAFAFVNHCLAKRSANARYLVACITLLIMLVTPATRLFWVAESLPVQVAGVRHEFESSEAARTLERRENTSRVAVTPQVTPQRVRLRDVTSGAIVDLVTGRDERELGQSRPTAALVVWLTYIWLVGVVVVAVRPMLGLQHARRCRTSGQLPVPASVMGSLNRLAERMNVRRAFQVAQSTLVEVPSVIGHFHPIILLPTSAATGLSPAALEAIVAHELAHIRRHDYAVNLLQAAIETLLFYHPAAWWVSQCIRRERENSCDDLALTICQNRRIYAQALLAIGGVTETRQLALTATGGVLFRRVNRILAPTPSRGSTTLTAIFVLCIVIALTVFAYWCWSVPSEGRTGIDDNIETKDDNMSSAAYDEFTATPAGICRAAREGDVDRIDWIVQQRPELVHIENPHNWNFTPVLHHACFAKRPVEIAAAFNEVNAVKRLLELGGSSKENPVHGYYSALSIGMKLKFDGIVEAVVDDIVRRVDKEPALLQTIEGPTLLGYAANNQCVSLLKALLEQGADVDVADSKGVRPIHKVVGNKEATHLLVDHDAKTDLWLAAAMGDVEIARQMLDADPSLVSKDFRPDSVLSDGLPLIVAARYGQAEMIKLLVERGADVNARIRGDIDRSLALYHAVDHGHFDVAVLLLDLGADKQSYIDSAFPIERAVRDSGHAELMARLLTDETRQPPEPASPGFVAWTGQIRGDIRQLPAPTPEGALSEIGAALYSHNRDGGYEDYKEIITVMLEQGADQNASMDVSDWDLDNLTYDQKTWAGTPLHWLSTMYLERRNYSKNPDMPTMEEMVDLAALFLRHGADIESRHPLSNHTPLSLAVENGHLEYVDFLLKCGAAVNADDPPATNPLDVATRLGFRDIAMLLSGSRSGITTSMASGPGKQTPATASPATEEEANEDEPPRGTLAYIEADRDELLEAYHDDDPDAIKEAHELLRRDVSETGLTIEDAELAVARAHDFESWERLRQHVSGLTADAMCTAATVGDVALVRRLAQARPELVTMERRGAFGEMTPLHFAVLNGHVSVVRLLMELGADARSTVYPHRRGTSPFELANDRGATEMLDIIRNFEQQRRAQQDINETVTDALTTLIDTIRQGRSDEAVGMLEEDESLRTLRNDTQSLPLHVAAGSHAVPVLKWLLARDPQLEAKDGENRTPLDRAAISGNDGDEQRHKRFRETVRLLLEAGARLTSRAAVVTGDREAVKRMHEAGEMEEPRGLYGGGLIDLAVQSDDIEMVRLLLDLGLDPDEPYILPEATGDARSDGAPLARAINMDSYDTVMLLLQRGASVNTSIYASGTPIMSALAYEDERYLNELLRRGARLNLYEISRRGRIDLVKAVLERGGKGVDQVELDEDEQTQADCASGMLCGAIDGGQVEVLRLCIPYLEAPPDAGLLPRTWWRVERVENLQMLLDAGADPNGVFRFGDTALHDLAKTRLDSEQQRLRFLEPLLKVGAGFKKRDIFFESTPLGWACRFGRLEMVKQLVEAGAPVNEPDAPAWATPLHWAEKFGHQEIADYLRSQGAKK